MLRWDHAATVDSSDFRRRAAPRDVAVLLTERRVAGLRRPAANMVETSSGRSDNDDSDAAAWANKDWLARRRGWEAGRRGPTAGQPATAAPAGRRARGFTEGSMGSTGSALAGSSSAATLAAHVNPRTNSRTHASEHSQRLTKTCGAERSAEHTQRCLAPSVDSEPNVCL